MRSAADDRAVGGSAEAMPTEDDAFPRPSGAVTGGASDGGGARGGATPCVAGGHRIAVGAGGSPPRPQGSVEMPRGPTPSSRSSPGRGPTPGETTGNCRSNEISHTLAQWARAFYPAA